MNNNMQQGGQPNLMQKLGKYVNIELQLLHLSYKLNLTNCLFSGDITANAPGGDILSKGKELIFMKFGLGGK